MEIDLDSLKPPVLVGERVAWLGSGSGLPMPSTVRWIGRIPEITDGWTVGIELDNAMPVGGIDGEWRKRKLFNCKPKHGLLVPIQKIMKQSSFLKTRHSISKYLLYIFYSNKRPVCVGSWPSRVKFFCGTKLLLKHANRIAVLYHWVGIMISTRSGYYKEQA